MNQPLIKVKTVADTFVSSEKSTSIYSGILRLVDLAKSLNRPTLTLFLVAPDGREKEIQAQLRRPSFKDLGPPLLYLLFSDLNCHCEGMCRFGEDYRVLLKLARGMDAASSTS